MGPSESTGAGPGLHALPTVMLWVPGISVDFSSVSSWPGNAGESPFPSTQLRV